MQRRLVLVIAGAVAAAVAVVGLGTLLLTGLDARRQAQAELARQVEELVSAVAETPDVRIGTLTRRLRPALEIDALLVVSLDGAVSSLSPSLVERLKNGETVSGRAEGRAFAAAPLQEAGGGSPTRALLAADRVGTDVGAAGRWFVIAGAVTVLAGGLVAWRLGRSLARPLAEVESATRRIAAGDMTARVGEPAGEDELTRLVRSINEMAESLERSRGLEREFLFSVSHDLRTPLTAILGWAEAVADQKAPDPVRAGETILAAARRLERLVADLLDLARLRARSFALDSEPVDLAQVVTETAEGLRPALADAGVSLSVEVSDSPAIVSGDASRMAQVFANLIENAGRHAASRVGLSVAGGEKVWAEVIDDGPGIPADQRDEVFETHTAMAGPAARSIGGSGMGLAIVRELVNAMGGTVSVEDGPQGGARFSITFPSRNLAEGNRS